MCSLPEVRGDVRSLGLLDDPMTPAASSRKSLVHHSGFELLNKPPARIGRYRAQTLGYIVGGDEEQGRSSCLGSMTPAASSGKSLAHHAGFLLFFFPKYFRGIYMHLLSASGVDPPTSTGVPRS